jgi:3-deoxy-D-manno-octulosonic-acid transferase
MLSAIYNLLWYPALPFALLAAHPASMRDYRERMGHGEFPETAGAPRIWIHAASVGEIEAIRPVAVGLLEHHPGAIMTITTMTATGREAAMRRIPARRRGCSRRSTIVTRCDLFWSTCSLASC